MRRLLLAQLGWVLSDLNPAIWEAIAGTGWRTDESRRGIKKQIPRFARNDSVWVVAKILQRLGVGGDGFEGVGGGG